MAKTRKKTSAKKTSAKKTSAKKPAGAKRAPSKVKPARKKAAVKPKSVRRPVRKAGSKSAKKAVSRKAAARPVKRVAPVSALALTAAAAEVTLSRADALQKKLDATKDLIKALSAHLTNTPADDIELNPNIDSLRSEQRTVEAQLAAAQTGTLAPPDDADVAALEKAVAAAEEVIAKNASVNELISAATDLIKTLKN